MSSNDDAKMYVVRALEAGGSICPERYKTMLNETPDDRVIANLDPWAFMLVSDELVTFCSDVLERPVLPFAHAIEYDLIACFTTEPSINPAVIVINPWSEPKARVVRSELPDYDAWLAYAERVSRILLAREKEEHEGDEDEEG